MGKYHTYILASTKRLGRFRKRLTTKSDWAITTALNLLWEGPTIEPKYSDCLSGLAISDEAAESGAIRQL